MGVTVFLRQGLLGEDGTQRFELPTSEGLTPRKLLGEIEKHLAYTDITVDVGIDGQRISDADLDRELVDGQTVIVVPVTTAFILPYLVYAVVMAVISAAISYAIMALSPRPKPPGVPQDRGDLASPTYSWDGIQTSYGQGFTVPAVYGRHHVGGQVIYTDIFAQSAGGFLDDRLNMILALSEGPIARIGDNNMTGQVDALGGILQAGTQTATQLPNHIRVNQVLLQSQATATTVVNLVLGAWSGGPQFDRGGILQVRNSSNVPIATVQVISLNNGTTRTNLDVIVYSGALLPSGTTMTVVDLTMFAPQATTSLTSYIITQRAGAPGALVYLRPGLLDQPPLPSNPWRGTSTTFSLNSQLDEAGAEAIHTYSVTNQLTLVGIVLYAPSGLFGLDNQGNEYASPVVFEVSWRFDGEALWRQFWDATGQQPVTTRTLGATPRQSPIIETFGVSFVQQGNAAITGPVQVRVKRLSPSGGDGAVSNCIWRNVFYNTQQELAYPRVALLGVTLSSGARYNGGLPEFLVRVDGIKVRVWHPTHGFSPRLWDAPTSGNWSFMTQPPGRNPAWVLLDFLTQPWGLGRYITDDDLDLPSFLRWAAFCDRDPSPDEPWNQPAFQCDIVMDASKPAWEWVIAICAAGRASPLFRNGKIGVIYDYRDSHSYGLTVTVPAIAPTQLITSGNCEKVQVTWLPRASRPTAFSFQFLNENLLHRQDVLVVEDFEGSINDPSVINKDEWRVETMQAFGVTRQSQLFREGVYRHRIGRLVTRELQFVTGRWALAAEAGDLIEFEHELLRPFDTKPLNMMVVVGGTGVSQVTIDHVIASSGQIVLRNADGAPIKRTFTIASTTLTTTTLNLSLAVTVAAGATVVVGQVDKLTEVYKIISISLDREMKREVRCLQWVPSIHDPITPSMYAAGGNEDDDNIERDSTVEEQEPKIESQDIIVTPQRDGTHRIYFMRLPQRRSSTARVYVRELDAPTWTLVGATEGDWVPYEAFSPGRQYEISVAFETFVGDAPQPTQGTIERFTAEEFPPYAPPRVSNVTATAHQQGVLLAWDAVEVKDFAEYEVRIGNGCWNGGRVAYKGKHPSTILPWPRDVATTAMVAVRTTAQLYGQHANVTVPANVPTSAALVLDENDLSPSPAGTHSGTEFAGGVLRLQVTQHSGTYDSAAQDCGFQAPFWWSIHHEVEVLDGLLVNDDELRIDSGEALWRTVNGRQASSGRPGVDFVATVDGTTGTVDDLAAGALVHGNRGEPSDHALVRVLSRYHIDGAWTEWKPHRDGVRAARQIQARLLFDRETLGHDVRVTRLHYTASI